MKYTLRTLRASKSWTQAQAAKEIGVPTEFWGSWARKRSYSDVPNISKIEQIFNVAYDDIIFCSLLRFYSKWGNMYNTTEKTEEMLQELDNVILKALSGAVDAGMDDIKTMVDIRGQLIYQKGL